MGLDRAARPAPRCPEVDHHGHLGSQHLGVEGLVRDVRDASSSPGYRRPRSARRRSAGTFHTASSTIARLIFEPPTTRSTKVIGKLDDAESLPQRPVGHLDLEGVAVRRHGVEVDRLQHVRGGST